MSVLLLLLYSDLLLSLSVLRDGVCVHRRLSLCRGLVVLRHEMRRVSLSDELLLLKLMLLLLELLVLLHRNRLPVGHDDGDPLLHD
jgi:hypothetical protein